MLDINDPQQVQDFTSQALSKGISNDEIQGYISKKRGINPSVPQIDLDPSTNQGIAPIKESLPPPVQKPQPMELVQPIQAPIKPSAPLTAEAPVAPAPSQSPVAAVLPQAFRVTQTAGTRNPVERYSGGVSRDTNFAAPMGTPTALPPGNWKVVQAFSGANPTGGNRGANQGYGNAVRVVNTENGDTLIFQHLSTAKARPGDILPGGTLIGTTGNSGNSTGPNLGIEYQDKYGRIREVTRSQYAPYLFAK